MWPTDGGIRVQRQTGVWGDVLLRRPHQLWHRFPTFYVCDPKVAKGVTSDPAVETAGTSDIYCKWFDTNAFY